MNQNTTLTIFAVAVLSAATGAAAARLFAPPSAATPAETDALELDVDPFAELGEMRGATDDLERRLGALELAAHSGARTAAGPEDAVDAGARLADLEARVAALTEQLANSGAPRGLPSATSEEMKLQVADALEEVRMDETVAKLTGRQEREAEQLDVRLEKYQAALGLSEGQVSDLRGMFGDRQRRERELVQLWRDGATEEAMSVEKQSLQDDMVNELGQVLSPQQYEDFFELQRAERGK